ncbi:MAG: reductive dehalogenase [Bacillota bacterium]
MLSEKQRQKDREKFLTTRRQFLKLGTAMGGAAGLFALMNKKHTAEAVTPKVLGSRVRQLGYEEGWLGTSRIVGPIQRTSEADHGFYLAARGFFGEDAKTQVTRFIPKHPLGGAISSMRTFIATEAAVTGNPAQRKLSIPDPKRMTEHIKKTAKFLKADEVGVGILPSYALYTHRAPPLPKVLYEGSASLEDLTPVVNNHPYVICILVDQNLETMLGSTGYDGISGSQSMMSYLTSGLIACTLAAYIRNLGYSARAHHCANYELALPPALISAGLGEMSRTGESVLHPRLGFRHKAAAVTTDLPLEPDGPIDFGLREFCAKCRKCAEHCPSGAISFEEEQTVYKGYMKWVNSIEKCTQFRVGNRDGSSCGRCMKVCPWNNKEDSWFHSAGAYLASTRSGLAATLLKEIDDMFGYGTEVVEQYRWWLEWPELY